MALDDYKQNIFGSMSAPKRAKQLLLADLKKARTSPQEMGLSKSEREQITSEATLAAEQQARAGAEQLAQAGLAGGGFTGQKAEGARQAQKSSAGAAAAASASAGQLSKQLAQRRYDQTRSRLEAQQERARQNSQFWCQQIPNMVAGLSAGLESLQS